MPAPAGPPADIMMHNFQGFLLAIGISFVAVLMHYEGLRLISHVATTMRLTARLKMLVVILGVVLAHMLEAGLYALGFAFGALVLQCGHFVGTPPSNAFQFYYFALETYTTQSVGDLYPVGGLRMMASLEPLVGLILIGWSASLSFMFMRRYWRVAASGRV